MPPLTANPSPLLRDVTDEEVSSFLRDGIVCLRQIIAPEWIEQIRTGMEEMRASPSPFATIVDKGETYLYAEQMPSVFNDQLRGVVRASGLGDISKSLLPGRTMRWLYDQLWYKGAGQVAETPWHQDTAYAYYQGLDIVRLWVPVDTVPRQTTLEIVRGSHLWNVVYAPAVPQVLLENKDHLKESKFSYTNIVDDGLPAVPDIEAHRESFDIVGYPVEPGDVVAFNYHVLHHAGSGFNPHARRRAFAVLFADEQITFRSRPNVVPGRIEHAGRTWQEGQTLADFEDLFPVA